MTTIIIKTYLIAVLAIAGFPQIYTPAQEIFEKEVELKNEQAVRLNFKFADEIKVKTWDKPKLYIKVTVVHNFKEKLDFQLLESTDKSEIEIEEKIKNLEKSKNRNIEKNRNQHDCINLDLDYEVFLPANAELTVNSISGNIEVKKMKNALTLETISGFVDVAIDPSKSYDLKCSTISGSIYSDLKFDSDDNIKADIVGSKLNSNINGGGKKIKLKSISGDLFIRKTK